MLFIDKRILKLFPASTNNQLPCLCPLLHAEQDVDLSLTLSELIFLDLNLAVMEHLRLCFSPLAIQESD